MANKSTTESDGTEPQLSLSVSDILALINKSSTDNAEVLAKTLSKYLSGKMKDEGELANERTLAKSTRENEMRKINNNRSIQEQCRHLQGMAGEWQIGKGAFAVWRSPVGELIGICQFCQKEISSLRPEDARFFPMRSGTMAESGQFNGVTDPIEAQLARFLKDDQDKIRASRRNYEKLSKAAV